MLEVEGLSKSFGGLKAVSDVCLQINEGELSSIIGPNGAGKSTFFNLLGGKFRPDSGKILFQGEDITGLPPHKVCRKGMSKSFQRQNIFPRLNAFENIQIAVLSEQKRIRNLALPAGRQCRAETDQVLERVGLEDKRDNLAGYLSYGDQKRLEIGIALATRPRLLLLDEPTAGMSPDETVTITHLIQKLAREQRLTLLFVEHDMSVVFGISEKIRVMHLGRIIAEGNPEEVQSNPEVQRIYLGETA
ncbi:MAG: ABC transporter ATP-binding protein [Deltaproteobacteria bacterium]|nr:ABC transporter ATP-binding protein [Deltaproteobacteria bacterium]